MSSNCKEFNELLLDFAYDELDNDTSARLRKHKETCDACRTAYTQLMGVRSVAGRIDAPQVPDSFDMDILALARKTATVMAANREMAVSVAPSPAVSRSISVIDRIQHWFFKPSIIGAGVALAAAFLVLVTIKGQPKKMLEPMDDAPFVGAESALEQEKLPPNNRANAEADDRAGSLDAPSAEVNAARTHDENAGPPMPQRVQKAAPGYEPLYEQKSSNGKNDKALGASSSRYNSGKIDIAPKVKKNPADLLQQAQRSKSSRTDASIETKSEREMTSDSKMASSTAARRSAVSGSAPLGPQNRKAADLDDLLSAKKQAPMSDQSEELESVAEINDAAPPAASAESKTGTSAFQAGLIAYNRGDCKTAISAFGDWLDSPSRDTGSEPVATHYIAKCEKRTGRCGKAVIHYERLLTEYTAYSRRSEALHEAAGCHIKLGHAQKAKSLLEELALDPDWREKAQTLLRKL